MSLLLLFRPAGAPPQTVNGGVAVDSGSAPSGTSVTFAVGVTQASYSAVKSGAAGAQTGPSWAITPSEFNAISVTWSGSVSTGGPPQTVSGGVATENDSATASARAITAGVASESDSATASARAITARVATENDSATASGRAITAGGGKGP